MPPRTRPEDQDERRCEIAAAIMRGITNGAIDPSEIYRDPTLKRWLEAREATHGSDTRAL